VLFAGGPATVLGPMESIPLLGGFFFAKKTAL